MSRTIRQLVEERSAEIVGRATAKAALLQTLEEGGPLVVFVHGIAGVGRSTLLEAFASEARSRGETALGRLFSARRRSSDRACEPVEEAAFGRLDQEEAFVEAWTAFAAWASSLPGAGTLKLTRDLRDVDVFVRFGDCASIDAVRAWKGGPEFKERLAQVLQHVSHFEPTELELVTTADAGAAADDTVHAF